MPQLIIPHTKDLTNELNELRDKISLSKSRKKFKGAFKKVADWGKFNYTNYRACKYAGRHFVYAKPSEAVDYFPIQPDSITHNKKKSTIKIKCLGIEEPFEPPLCFIRIKFIHVFSTYLLIEYVEATDFDEFRKSMENALAEVMSYIYKRDEDMTDELRALAVYKVRYIKRVLMDEMGKSSSKIRNNFSSMPTFLE